MWQLGSTRTRWGVYSAPPDSIAGFRGQLIRERKGTGRNGRVRREGDRNGEGRGG